MAVRNISSALLQPKWPVENVLAMQTTRLHPSQANKTPARGHFQFFNLGTHVGDCLDMVEANRQALQAFLPEQTHIQWLQQVHGNHVVEITQPCISEQVISHSTIPSSTIDPQTVSQLTTHQQKAHRDTNHYLPIADAVFTREKNIALAIMTADCLPILLSTKKGSVIAAIHGGWRCLASNIIARTLMGMQQLPENIYAWLGPCIGKNAFEVGQEVKAHFVEKNIRFQNAFTQSGSNSDKYFADLQQIARLQLQQLGVYHISALPECTYTNNQHYYSYRKEGETGRMATLICRL